MCSSRMRMKTSFPFQKTVQPSSSSTLEACTSFSYSNSSLRMWMRYVFKTVPSHLFRVVGSTGDSAPGRSFETRVSLASTTAILVPFAIFHRCPRAGLSRTCASSARWPGKRRPALIYIAALPCARKSSAAVINGRRTSRAADSPSPTRTLSIQSRKSSPANRHSTRASISAQSAA
jgi:hypothetical protein